MARLLAAAALALFGAFGTSYASACEYSENGINVCLSEQECSGFVSICPMADAEHCHSSVDVCLDFVGPR